MWLFRLTRYLFLQYPGMGTGRSQEEDGGSGRGHRLRSQTLESPENPSLSLTIHSLPTLRPNLKHNPCTTNRYQLTHPQPRTPEHELDLIVLTMIQKTKIYVGPLEPRMLP